MELYEDLVFNAAGGQSELVIQGLMNFGILNKDVYCSSDHERKRMTLQPGSKRW